MITPHLSSNRDDSASAAEVKTRRARAAAAGHETYGAENLPVLIRLPDLTTTQEPVVAIPVPAASDEAATVVDAPSDCVRDSRPIATPLRTDADRGNRRRVKHAGEPSDCVGASPERPPLDRRVELDNSCWRSSWPACCSPSS